MSFSFFPFSYFFCILLPVFLQLCVSEWRENVSSCELAYLPSPKEVIIHLTNS